MFAYFFFLSVSTILVYSFCLCYICLLHAEILLHYHCLFIVSKLSLSGLSDFFHQYIYMIACVYYSSNMFIHLSNHKSFKILHLLAQSLCSTSVNILQCLSCDNQLILWLITKKYKGIVETVVLELRSITIMKRKPLKRKLEPAMFLHSQRSFIVWSQFNANTSQILVVFVMFLFVFFSSLYLKSDLCV